MRKSFAGAPWTQFLSQRPRCIESGWAITCTLPPKNSVKIHLAVQCLPPSRGSARLLQKEPKWCKYLALTPPSSQAQWQQTPNCSTSAVLPGEQPSITTCCARDWKQLCLHMLILSLVLTVWYIRVWSRAEWGRKSEENLPTTLGHWTSQGPLSLETLYSSYCGPRGPRSTRRADTLSAKWTTMKAVLDMRGFWKCWLLECRS